MGKWTTVLLFAAVATSGCGGGGAVVTTTSVDSAGVLIVESLGPDRTVAGAASIDYRLGGKPSGPESFYQIYPWQVAVSASGVIAVVDPHSHQVSTFSPEGVPLSTYGREGSGPGEFRYPSSIALKPNGEVLVYDFQKRALVRFAADGTVLDESRPTVPVHGLGMVGSHSGLTLLSDTRPRGDGTLTRRILHLTPTDTVQLGPAVSGPTKTVRYQSCGVSMSQPPLFAADLVWASNGGRTAVAAGPDYSVWVFDDTTLVHVVRRNMQPETVTEAVAAREIGEGERWGVGGQPCLVPADEVLEQRGYATAVPIVEAVAVTPSGGLWVRRRNTGTRELSVDVFDEDGLYLGTVSPSPPFPVAFLPDGGVVSIEKDSLDVQTLAVYEVEIGGA